MNTKIRLIASDMDGTLLNSKGLISEGNLEAIKQVQAKGIIFAICTGRFAENVGMMLDEINLNCPVISLNGCLVQDAPFGKLLSENPMDAGAALQVQKVMEESGVNYHIFSRSGVYSSSPKHLHHSQLTYGDRIVRRGNVHYASGKEACRQAAHGIVYKYYAFVKSPAELLPLKAAFSGIDHIDITQSSDFNIEIMPANIDKGTGIKALAEAYGFSLQETMVLGDHLNDLPMFEKAGFSVAMENAVDEIKKIADAISAGYEEDGVAQAIRRYILN